MSKKVALDISSHVERLASQLVKNQSIRSPLVEAAFRRVPRHRFIDRYFLDGWIETQYDMSAPTKVDLDYIYSDTSIVTLVNEKNAPSSSSSAPTLVADMLEQLDLRQGMKVLEIGTGTGYNAALLAEIVGDQHLVVSVDIAEHLVTSAGQHLQDLGYTSIKLMVRDGFEGVPEEGPFDRIIVTVGCPDLSPYWVSQLKPDGFMLVPLLHCVLYPVIKVWQDGKRIVGRIVRNAGFMPIQGNLQTTELWPNGYLAYAFPKDTQVVSAIDGLESMDIQAFHDFVSLRDSRAFRSQMPRAYGFYDGDNGAIAIHSQTGHVLLKGDQTLYAELLSHYNEWCAAGRPRLADFDAIGRLNHTDFNMEFIPIEREMESTSQSTWIKRRVYYQQVFSLSVPNH